MKFINYISTISLILFSLNSFSKNIINPTDTVDIIVNSIIKGEQIAYTNPDSGKILIETAYRLSKEIKNDTLINISLLRMGNIFESKGLTDSAIYFYKKYYDKIKNKKDSNLIVVAYNNIGNAYYYKSEFSLALSYYHKALIIYNLNNDETNIGLTLHNIGLVHDDMGNHELGAEYYNKAKNIFIKTNSKDLLATCYNSLASTYQDNDYEKSIDNFRKSLLLFKEVGDSIGVCMVYSNIGDLKSDYNELDSAVIYLKRAAKLALELNDWFSLSGTYANIANLNIKQKEYYLAIIHSQKSLKYAKLGSSLMSQLDAFQTLKEANFAVKNYIHACNYTDSIIIMSDSITGIEKEKDIELMESRYQSEQKKLEIENLEKETDLSNEKLKKQKTQLFYLILIIVIFIIFLFVIIKLLRNKQKTNKELNFNKDRLTESNEELNQLVEEVTTQRDEIDIQKQKIEILYNDVSESIVYAKKIQDTLLPDSSILKDNLSGNFNIFKPKDVVSGDFYWFTKIDNQLIIAMSDCTGHGVPGALMSMLGISFLREIVNKERITQPALILQKLRKEIIHSLNQKGEIGEQKDGMDISIININTDTLEMQFAGANNPIYITTENKWVNMHKNVIAHKSESTKTILYELKPDKMPIAIFVRMDKFTNYKYQLKKGDNIYLFSDGFADQFGGPKGKKIKYKAFRDILSKVSNDNMETRRIKILKYLEDWQQNYNQIDDITILGIQI